MPSTIASLFAFEGRITRTRYLAAGLILFAIKFLIDSAVAHHFGVPWHIWNYVVGPRDGELFAFAPAQRNFYATLWLVAIPFFWIGIALTLRRLRDAGHRLGWIFLFFCPVLNLIFFLALSILTTASDTERAFREHQAAEETLPTPKPAPVLGVFVAAIIGFALACLGANHFANYGWGLFLGVPFLIGFVASWFYNAPALHSRKQTTLIATISILITGLLLIGFRVEGLICLGMALPLALPCAIAGALAARRCLDNRRLALARTGLTACVAIVPLLLLAEHALDLTPPTAPVVTTIVINAPVATVWQNVIAFPELAPPDDLLFRSGIAFPIGATITPDPASPTSTLGVGSIRRCRFSTGDFVEPITTWDPNHLLAFNVASEPPSLHELALPGTPLHTPHIDRNYMRSHHGQFRLTALDPTHTLLEGTTWYQDYFWPQIYWRPISDAIVHRIHTRVLTHIKTISETHP